MKHNLDDAGCAGPTFIDAFAGCGGLSLGLMQAGWTGICAIEKDSFAFETIQANFLRPSNRHRYRWPDWLPKHPHTIEELLNNYAEKLSAGGDVDLLAGGPPCQGFSTAGRRQLNDPRNQMAAQYLQLISIVRPKVVLLENVRGFTYDFAQAGRAAENFSSRIVAHLSESYIVHTAILRAADYGVPQARPRFFLIGLRRDIAWPSESPFELLASQRTHFLSGKRLSLPVTVKDAISDFERNDTRLQPSRESVGFLEIAGVHSRTQYQKLMNGCVGAEIADTRLANHRPDIIERFQRVIKDCKKTGRLSTHISPALRADLGIKKQAFRVLDPNAVAPTITSMPDDLLHYDEPRTLTVRENARLQSFPDWFEFKGKYTTGGKRRRSEVPRFTQVANAVPPLLAEQLGNVLKRLIEESAPQRDIAAYLEPSILQSPPTDRASSTGQPSSLYAQ